MTTQPILAALSASAKKANLTSSTTLSNYWALTKPEINFLIAITTAAAFCVSSSAPLSHFPWASLLHTVLGTVFAASGAATLNQLIEVHFDAQMRRTARRPLASGRIEHSHALWFGISLSLFGVAYLGLFTNLLATLLAALTILSYLFLYTPLKRITPLCTLVGAIPGAAPSLIGWAAARGHLDMEAWLLWGIVFLWQFPHFMAIAWMYREDYARAGYMILPLGEKRDRFVTWQTSLASLALLPVALIPMSLRVSGPAYYVGRFTLGAIFLYYGIRFAFRKSNAAARDLLVASILYLPLLFALMMLNTK